MGRAIGLIMAGCLLAAGVALPIAHVVATRNAQISDLHSMLSASQLQVIPLAGNTAGGRGRIFWDHDRNEWNVFVVDLKPTAPRRTFVLWFVGNDGRNVLGGVVPVNAFGTGSLKASVPAELRPITRALVTEETSAAPGQPTLPARLAGDVR